MITYITHMRVAAANAAAFEAVVVETAERVSANEPGVVHFALSRDSADPELYLVVEVYRDESAFRAHWQTDYIRPALAKSQVLMREGSVETKRYESP